MFARRDVIRGVAAAPLAAVLADPVLAATVAAGLADVEIATADGRTVRGALALPAASPAPAVVLIHEWWGLNDQIKAVTAEYARSGYVALAVDLFGGRVAASPDEARQLTQSIKPPEAIDTLSSWGKWLKAHEQSTGKLGSVGWCFGGGWSLEHAIATPDLDACVIYYGRLVTEPERLATIRAPILGIFGRQDRGIPPAAVAEFEAAIQAADLPAGHVLRTMTLDAPHAFANPSSARYVPEAAEAAWREARAFLAARLKR